ncbi:MAG: nitrite reductase, partial [Gammaproteobacteria bacterium]
MKLPKLAILSAAVALATAVATPISIAADTELSLSDADFEHAKTLYFQRCAGCHGVLRKGATGKSLEPINTIKKGQARLEKILTYGTEGGMNNFNDIFSKDEIKMMATYIQLEPPIPPEMSLELMQSRTKVYIEPKDYPTKPMHDRNWENFFVVIERDAGKVAIIDGDKHEIYAHLDA